MKMATPTTNSNCVILTVRTAIDFDSEPDAAFPVPVQGHHAHIAGNDRVL